MDLVGDITYMKVFMFQAKVQYAINGTCANDNLL